jgi:hypothetical protein
MGITKVNLDELLSRSTEHWSPQSVGRLNDYEGFERPKLTGGGLRRAPLEDAACTAGSTATPAHPAALVVPVCAR